MGKKWGIMVYMAADNDLTQASIFAISQIHKAFSDNREHLADIELYLYFDGNGYAIPSLEFSFSDPDPIDFPIPHFQEFKSSPGSIFKFVQSCHKNRDGFCEIENYALIISSHGFGFQEDTLLDDDSSRSSASIEDLAYQIGGLNELYLGGRLKILGFDSCVMNAIEVAFEFTELLPERRGIGDNPKKKAEMLKDVFLVSSEGLVPEDGWDYAQLIERLAKRLADPLHNAVTPQEMAKFLVDSYIEEYERNVYLSGISVDIAGFSLGSLDTLAHNVNELGEMLVKELHSDNCEWLENAILNAHSKAQTYLFDQAVDIKDFCCEFRKLIVTGPLNDSTIIKKLIEIEEHFDKENVYCQSRGIETQFSNGISLFFPWTYHSLLIVLSKYRDMRFASLLAEGREKELSGWPAFMWHYLKRTMRVAETPQPKDMMVKLLLERQIELSSHHSDRTVRHSLGGVIAHKLDPAAKSKLDPPAKSKLDPPAKSKLDPPTKSKLDPAAKSKLERSLRSKLDPAAKSKLGALFFENFRRTHNIEWLSEFALHNLLEGVDPDTGNIREKRRGEDRRELDRPDSTDRRRAANG